MSATVVGLIVFTLITGVIGTMCIVGMIASGSSAKDVSDNTVMVINLSGMLNERSESTFMDEISGNTVGTIGLDDVLSAIDKAKGNDKIKGIYIEAGMLSADSYASLAAIRNALLDFKKSGKWVVAYGDVYTQGVYYVASAADKVFLNPSGQVDWHGIASQPIFLKDVMAKFGVKMQLAKVGAYKSAPEMFTADKMSDANREQVKAFTSSIWETFINDISKSRDMTPEALNACADRGIMFEKAESFVDCGFVDSLAYRTDMTGYLKTKVGIDADDDLNTLSLAGVTGINANVPKDKSGNIVAVYYADGDIDDTKGKDRIGALRVISDLEALQNDKDVKAVVLRVNSPGGSAFGSEQIWKQVRDLKAEKPVVVSMGGYAASGGYYISCNADYIYAQPTTLTGSIGIFGMVPDGSGLLDKVGISSETVSTNKFGGMMSFDRAMTEEEKALMQRSVNDGYDLFVARCADGRKMPVEDIKKIAEGRVWTGEMAKDLKLVDELGGIDRAIAIAAERAEITEYTVMDYPKQEEFFLSLLNSTTDHYLSAGLKEQLGEWYEPFRFVKNLKNADHIQARMPFILTIN